LVIHIRCRANFIVAFFNTRHTWSFKFTPTPAVAASSTHNFSQQPLIENTNVQQQHQPHQQQEYSLHADTPSTAMIQDLEEKQKQLEDKVQQIATYHVTNDHHHHNTNNMPKNNSPKKYINNNHCVEGHGNEFKKDRPVIQDKDVDKKNEKMAVTGKTKKSMIIFTTRQL